MAYLLLRNQRGSQIIQMLTATVILTSTALAVFNMFITNKNIAVRVAERSGCQAYIDSAFARISAMGIRVQAQPPPPAPLTRYTAGVPVEMGIAQADRWPNEDSFNVINYPGTRVPMTHKSAWLIQGAMNGLLSIYNSGTYCTASTAYVGDPDPTRTLLPNQAQEGMSGVNATIQIQPYNLDDRTLAGCPQEGASDPLIIAPRSGMAIGADASAQFSPDTPAGAPANDVATDFPSMAGVRNDLGLLTTVTVNYIGENGQNMTCSGQARYEYPTDVAAPNFIRVPYVAATAATMVTIDGDVYNLARDNARYTTQGITRDYATTQPPVGPPYDFQRSTTADYGGSGLTDYNLCTAGNSPNPISGENVVLDFGYKVGITNLEPGTVLACRDVSVRFNSSNNRAYCMNDSGTHFARRDCGQLDAFGTGACAAPNVTTTDIFDPGTGWVECSAVEACGVAPTGPASVAGGNWSADGLNVQYINDYPNLPASCEIRIEMAAIDSAGNVTVNLISQMVRGDSDCGNFCGVWPGAGFPDGYFYCGACPAAAPPDPTTIVGTWSGVLDTTSCGPSLPCANTCTALGYGSPPTGTNCGSGFPPSIVGDTCYVNPGAGGAGTVDVHLCQ